MAVNMSLADQAVQALAMVKAMDEGLNIERTRSGMQYEICNDLQNRKWRPGWRKFTTRYVRKGGIP